jgi:hypothetical protein
MLCITQRDWVQRGSPEAGLAQAVRGYAEQPKCKSVTPMQ